VDNQQDTLMEEAENTIVQLPFLAFFSLLKNNGFAVTTQQIIDANKIIINYAGHLKNEEELCLYLLPIFTGTEDEQELFKKLFLKYFRTPRTPSVALQTKKELLEKKLKRNWKKILIFYGLVALLLVTMITIIYQEFTRPRPERISILLTSSAKSFNQNSFSVTPNQVLTLKTICKDDKKRVRTDITIETRFNWGDGSPVESKNSHAYKLQGKYDLTAFIEVLYEGSLVKFDTIRSMVLVCAETKSLQINFGGKNKIPVGEKIFLSASVNNNNQPDYIEWLSENVHLWNGYNYQASFNKTGTYSISCRAVYDSINSPCSIQQNIFFTVFDPALVKADTTGNSFNNQPASDIVMVRKGSAPFLVPLYICLAILFGALALFFAILNEKEKINSGNFKKSVLDKYSKLTATFSGKKTPGFIPFRNKNYIPVHQSEINYAARQMRKRVQDNSKFLHIGKTISKSIENNGLLQPVLLPRTRQTEYLILVDENKLNSQLVKLYEYLALEFTKQNILVEKYFYRNDPERCYRLNEPGTTSLEKLFTKYENHVLLIFGDAHQLINKFHAVFDSEYLALLNRWQHKAILTPVSYIDWGTKEKSILLPHIPIFPLDIEGILLMAACLADEEQKTGIISGLNQYRSLFYKVEGLNFERIEDLERYCAQAKWATVKQHGQYVNILFQWIAALAVYPKISWEVIIAIGKSILDKYNCVNELNFTSLLRIARINWMKEGRFPDAVRFELLKKLSTENELLARETMLMLFKEIPASEIKQTSQAYEEKEIQQIVNEFSLYANDPVYYSAFKESKAVFEKFWKDKKLNDAATALYFNNPDKSWKTIINAPALDNHVSVGIEEYFDANEKEETILSKLYLWLCLISLFVFVTSLFALIILYKWKTGTDRDPNELTYIQGVLANVL
jgi:preprotein translocase subunit SecG